MNLKHLKTGQLIALYNLATGKTIKKFATRSAAEAQTAKAMSAVGPLKPFFDRVVSAGIMDAVDISELIDDNGGELAPDAPERDLGEPQGISIDGGERIPAKTAKAKKAPASPATKKKQKPRPHVNLRCRECGYFAKTTIEMNDRARLRCPVDVKHGRLLTPEERGENRGR